MDWSALAIAKHMPLRDLDAVNSIIQIAALQICSPKNVALHSDLSPCGGATKYHAALPILERLACCVSRAAPEASVKHPSFEAWGGMDP